MAELRTVRIDYEGMGDRHFNRQQRVMEHLRDTIPTVEYDPTPISIASLGDLPFSSYSSAISLANLSNLDSAPKDSAAQSPGKASVKMIVSIGVYRACNSVIRLCLNGVVPPMLAHSWLVAELFIEERTS